MSISSLRGRALIAGLGALTAAAVALGGIAPATANSDSQPFTSVTVLRPGGYSLALAKSGVNSWSGVINLQYTYQSSYAFTVQAQGPSGAGAYGTSNVGPGPGNYNPNADNFLTLGGAPVSVAASGSYRIQFNGTTKKFTLTKQSGAPYAVAGAPITVRVGQSFTLNGSFSHDPEGGPLSYEWYGRWGGPGNSYGVYGTTAVHTASIPQTGIYPVGLTVRDQTGAVGTASQIVHVIATLTTYNQVYLRGTHNGWGTDVRLASSGNYQWRTVQYFGAGSQSFKFDVHGDWSVNFGENNADGVGDANGANIPITQGAGYYDIGFNDQTKAYTVVKLS